MNKIKYIAVASAIAMMGFAGTASATWTTGGDARVVSTNALATTLAAVKTNVNLVFTANGAILNNAGLSVIKLTLSAGIWNNTVTVTPAGALDIGGTPVTATVPAAGVGTATITYNVAAKATLASDTLTINTFTLADLDLSGVAAGTTVDITLTAFTAGGVLIGTQVLTTDLAAGNALAKLTSVFSHAETAVTETADVAAGFLKFLSTGTTSTQTGASAAKLSVTQATTAVPAAVVHELITLSGNFAGIKSIAASNGTGSDAAGVITVVAGTTKGTANQFWIDTPNGKAYLNVPTTNNNAAVAINPVFTTDGTAISPASFSVDVSRIADANFTAGVVGAAAAPLLSITRNGALFTSDNISTSSVIRIADNNTTGTTGRAVTYAAWDANGVAVTQVGATLPTSVIDGHIAQIGKGVLKAAFPTAVRFNINIESSNVSVTHFKQNAAGLNVIVGTTGTAKQL